MIHQVLNGDCLEVLRGMADNSVDSIVTDPPAGIAFMGKEWDRDKGGRDAWIAWMRSVAAECLRVIKPGGHAFVWAIPRTSHWTGMAWEDAGWQPRDKCYHIFGSGFPKSHNLSGEWNGWGTALKPAAEEWWLFRKPLAGTVAANVLAWGTGALNVDGCRVGDDVVGWGGGQGGSPDPTQSKGRNYRMAAGEARPVTGRWPANLVHDGSEEATAGLGSAARFFYAAKASRSERDAGLDDSTAAMRNDGRQTDIDNPYQRGKVLRNPHPTVKPVALMRWLCRLVTPPGGVVLDPFAGSGSTGVAAVAEGFSSILIERDAEYVEIIRRRLAHAQGVLFSRNDD